MKRRILFAAAAVLTLALVLAACAARGGAEKPTATQPSAQSTDAQSAYHAATAEEAKLLLDENAELVLVDVRRADEYAASHIPGAINIPNERISGDALPPELTDADAAIMVYCRTGVRSRQAAEKLISAGCSNVTDMGGITSWPYATVSGSEAGVYPR